jgi:hypothetical protein
MRSHTRSRLAVILSAPALVLTVAATTAAATWSVSPGGAFELHGKIGLEDTRDSTTLVTCEATLGGTLKSGSGLKGTGIGSIKTVTLSSCTGLAGATFTLTARGLPWTINALSYSGGTSTGSISGIKLGVSTTSCSSTVAGTSANSPGTEKFRYSNSTHKITLLPTTSNMHFWDVSGCLGLLNDGDGAALTGTLTSSPTQTITES